MYLNTLGAVLYRAGKWDEAKAALEQSRRAYVQFRRREQSLNRADRLDVRQSFCAAPRDSGTGGRALIRDEDGTVWDWLFLALTCRQLGDTDAARKWLRQARDGSEGEAAGSWVVRAELELLLAEAAAAIEPPIHHASRD
jgi:tetratricopeptide (TPR) repeat protein